MTRAIVFTLGALLLVAGPARAQYFGRNKVQSARFDFRILETPHFDLYYYPSEHDAAVQAGRMAERWYTRLSAVFDHRFARRQPIILYASHGHFAQTTVLSEFIPEGVGGFTDHLAGRVVLPLSAGLAETDHVLGHELVHAFQREILKQHGQSLSMLPLWFAEGMAEYLSVGPLDTNTLMWLRDAAAAERLPAIGQLADPRWFPYRYGQALWTFLAERYGSNVALRALAARGKGGAVGRLRTITGASEDQLSRDWHRWIREVSAVAPAGAASPAVEPSAAIVTAANAGRLNVGPALSPDGTAVVFLSERDGLSVDVYLANAITGTVIRKILSTAADPHFDSLQFLDSAGSWSANGHEFVLGAIRDGEAVLTILAMPGGGVSRELPVPGVDQVYSPSWSPDGRRIAFSAMRGGVSDLFVIDVASGDLRALTGDMYSDLQPSWSPDGRSLVFATDRFSSSPDALVFGAYRLGMIDVDSGTISPLPSYVGAKNIDPHWAPDGRSVLFLSDAGGTTNVYRTWPDTGVITRVSDVRTGVSGITALSPALSVALHEPRVVFSVYSRGTYELHALSLEAGASVDAAALLPARPIAAPFAAALIEPPSSDAVAFTSRAYVPTLSLAGIGQPYMSAGGGAFGSFLRAGTSISFGDMLGQQRLETAIQAGKSLMDFAVQAAYENRRSRWTWGVAAGQVPAISGLFQSTTTGTTSSGDVSSVRTDRQSQQIHRQVSGVVAYPFSRAQRVEFTAGLDAVSFSERVTTTTFAAATGQLLDETNATVRSAPSATVFETGAALVYDTAVLGPTSPILGQRYRIAVAPSLGDVSFVTAVTDYRRYFMPIRPVTFAIRAEHVGRFGEGASDPRLLPIVWTVRDVVRGYDDTSSGVWSAQRFAAMNAEVRMPIPGVFRGQVRPSALPIEGIVFADWGRFWSPRPGLSTSVSDLASVGAGVRLNAAGFVFEFAAARTLTTVGAPRGWKFAVNFRPGF